MNNQLSKIEQILLIAQGTCMGLWLFFVSSFCVSITLWAFLSTWLLSKIGTLVPTQ